MTVPAAILDPGRLAAVAGSGLLDTPAEEAFDRLADMAGRLLDAPFAFVTIVDANRSYWKSCIGVGISGDNTIDRQNSVEESFCQYVVGSGEKLIVGDTRADARTRDNPSIEAMGVEAWAGYPVLSPSGEILGTFCVVDTKTREWSAQDERVLETLAEAASREIALRAAIESAEALARSLQASLLPQRLPVVPGIDIVARYAPAGTGAEVLGDFYDVIALGDDRWGIAIGDVCGKGVEAAKVTALARYTIRAAATLDPDPGRVLGVLNRAMLDADLPEAFFLSAQYGVLDGATLRLSSAGHPPPLVRRADGRVEDVAVSGTLLGLFEEPALGVHEITLAGGDALVLYTDGVTEARGTAGLLGDDGLRAAMGASPSGAGALADHIEAAVRSHSRGPLSDDMAVLVVSPH
jgi:sigma-B regulation protein RsbU (phosphoserine phosphatase)